MNQKGLYLALATAFISGFAVFLNKFAVTFWGNSSVFTTAKNMLVAVFLTAILLLIGKISELKSLSPKNWFRLVLIGFVGGFVPFLLFFKGLTLASSANAAFIHKTLFIWVTVLALLALKEKLSRLQISALAILAISVFMIGPPSKIRVGYGELLVFAATLLWAIENIIAKAVLKSLSSFVVAWGRMFFGSAFLIGFLLVRGGTVSQLIPQSPVHGFWLVMSGVILFGYVASWYSAIKLIPVSVAAAILVIAAPITIILNSIFVTKSVPAGFLLPAVFIITGVVIIAATFKAQKTIRQLADKSPSYTIN